MKDVVKTTCPYCGVGCGVEVTRLDDGQFKVAGDKAHPANLGRLCSKGSALSETLDLDGRLLHPVINGRQVDWNTALETVADRFKAVIDQYGPEAVAFYVSGQLLTEDYYVANKLMKGFIGSANIDTNSRLCMSSAVAGHTRAFGADAVPCSYEDLERAQLLVITGSNTAWCHPVVYQRIALAKKNNPDLKIVLIDPRKTATAGIADLHLPIKPGSDPLLFNGLLAYLAEQDEINKAFIARATNDFDDALVAARRVAGSLAVVAEGCGLSLSQLEEFYRLFSRTERVVTLFSQGINQSSYGTDKVNAIINCHLATGRIGRPGMGPFSITGQPNAMGGREVGGLATQLAAHMHLHDDAHRALVQRFWSSPVIADKPGYKAVDLFRAMEQGKVKAVWIMATNPAVSLPDANQVRQALANCELVVVSDCVARTDTSQYADILLPAQGWGEKDGTVTNSERCISHQRAFLESAGEAKPDWWIVCEVAKRLGFKESFDYPDVASIFREHARLSGEDNNGSRDFDISGLAELSDDEYENLVPVQWPVKVAGQGTERLFTDEKFYTPNGKANFIAVGKCRPVNAPDKDYPLVLNSGRVRDHWHTMTRTAKSARLSSHILEPFAEIHSNDAVTYGINDQSLVTLSTQWGVAIVRARVTVDQQAGSVFSPIHWNEQYSSLKTIDALINPEVDALSGQPEFKHTPVSIAPYKPQWHGFVLSRRKITPELASYWSMAKGNGYWRYEVAGDVAPEDWAVRARTVLCADQSGVEWIEYKDAADGRYRAARLVNGQLESCWFIGPEYTLPPRDWLVSLFAEQTLDDRQRQSILLGKPMDKSKDQGETVCACFSVGINTIRAAIEEKGLTTVEQIGQCLKAGTNCGSCVPELTRLLEEAEQPAMTG